jgi:Zn-dependent protease with chaperone function
LAAKKGKAEGYAEYKLDPAIIVEGQVIVTNHKTKYGRQTPHDVLSIPLGSIVKVKGKRQPDGSILASKVEMKLPVRDELDQQIEKATNEIEQKWVKEGEMFMVAADGSRKSVGKILESGPQVVRVRGIMRRLLPPYISEKDVRVRVVETDEWNASAMGNGAIWVYSGLIKDMSDDEIAVILGHELTHFSHQHTKRNVKKAQWGQLAALGAMIGLSTVGSGAGRGIAGLGAGLGLSAWQSGYSRELEDQADRVGLRYAYEAEFDISKGTSLWAKFREKYGEQDKVSNFIGGSHSRPTDRIENIEKQLKINYPSMVN